MAEGLDKLEAAVAHNTSVEQSALTLIQGLAQQIKDAAAANDSAKLNDLADQLNNQADSLASAVAANTAPAPVATQADASSAGGGQP